MWHFLRSRNEVAEGRPASGDVPCEKPRSLVADPDVGLRFFYLGGCRQLDECGSVAVGRRRASAARLGDEVWSGMTLAGMAVIRPISEQEPARVIRVLCDVPFHVPSGGFIVRCRAMSFAASRSRSAARAYRDAGGFGAPEAAHEGSLLRVGFHPAMRGTYVLTDDGRLELVPARDALGEACDTFSVGRSDEACTRRGI